MGVAKLQLVRAFGDHHMLCHLVHNNHCELAKLVTHGIGIPAAGHGNVIGITPT